MDHRWLVITVTLFQAAHCSVLQGCSEETTSSIHKALSPLEAAAQQDLMAALHSGDIRRILQSFCNADATDNTLSAVLESLQLSLRDCDQSLTAYKVLGVTELVDLVAICWHQNECANLPTSFIEMATCIAGLDLTPGGESCAVLNSSCSCILQQPDNCSTVSLIRWFYCRVQQMYNEVAEGGCESMSQCEVILTEPEVYCHTYDTTVEAVSTTSQATQLLPTVLLLPLLVFSCLL